MATQRYFHLHLVSDATGETLVAVGRAAAAQYKHSHAIEHIHSVVRTQALAEQALTRDRAIARHRALHAGRSGACDDRSRTAAATSAFPASRSSIRCLPRSSPISARARTAASARSTCSTPSISAASRR